MDLEENNEGQEKSGTWWEVFRSSVLTDCMYNMWLVVLYELINSQLSYLIKPNETKIRQNNDKNMTKCDKLKWGKDLKNLYIGHMITK